MSGPRARIGGRWRMAVLYTADAYLVQCGFDWRRVGMNICKTGGSSSLVSHNNPQITVYRTDYYGDLTG